MVDTESRKSGSPRESLAHIISVHKTYLKGSKSKNLVFKEISEKDFSQMSKDDLLDEFMATEQEMFDYFNDPDFDPDEEINVPWGTSRRLGIFWAMNEHMVQHIGWNLAVMDHLDISRFDSIKIVWGE